MNQGRDFSALRLLISGGGMGAKVMPLLALLCDTLHCDFMGIWGQTECTGPVTVVKTDVAFSNPYTCGKPMRGIDLQIWSDHNEPLPIGETGEIMVRSPMTASYWDNPEANAVLYTGEWLHTGIWGSSTRGLSLLHRSKEGPHQDRRRERVSTSRGRSQPASIHRR
jgi:long-subunit acyl-CoA synthetase (AMP-forming)